MKDLKSDLKSKAWDVCGSKKFELMHATPKLFVERKSNDFHLARGYYIGFGLALVKVQYEAGSFEFVAPWYIIDIATGLHLRGGFTQRKDALGYMNSHIEVIDKLIQTRQTDMYFQRINECLPEKAIWRDSGYEVQ